MILQTPHVVPPYNIATQDIQTVADIPVVGTAVVADVASGKTFSNVSSIGLTGTSTKNATVPSNAPIQPPQAFVDNIAKFANSVTAPTLSGTVTKLNGSLVAEYAHTYSLANDSAPELIFSGKSLDQESVDGIPTELASGGTTNGALDLSGGTNAAPIPQIPNQSIDVSNYNLSVVNSIPLTYPHGGLSAFVIDHGTAFSGSSGTNIGVSDNPSATTVATYMASHISSNFSADEWSGTSSDGSVVTIPKISNADVLTLRSNGWTVTTN